jgi:hypothetical protein
MSRTANNRATEVTVYGDEPSWEGCDSWDAEKVSKTFMLATQWYNYMSDEKDHKKWLMEYCKANCKESAPKISKLDNTSIKYGEMAGDVGFNPGIYARILNLGGKLPEKLVADLKAGISYLCNKSDRISNKAADQISAESPKQKPPKEISVRDRSIQKALDANLEIEKFSDYVLTSNKAFTSETIKDIFKDRSIKPSQAANIVEIWSDKKKIFDPEDYYTYEEQAVKSYQSFIDLTIKVASEISSVKKIIIHKPRKKSPVDQVKKLKYKKEDTTLKVTSILPSKIIGSTKLVLFNTKYSKISYLEAGNAVGFTVKGNIIMGYDDTKSYTKKVRDPKKVMGEIQNKGIRIVKSVLDGLKTKKMPISCRMSEEVLIVGVY